MHSSNLFHLAMSGKQIIILVVAHLLFISFYKLSCIWSFVSELRMTAFVKQHFVILWFFLESRRYHTGDEDFPPFYSFSMSNSGTPPASPQPRPRMATIGSIEPFDPSTGDWSSYAARLDQYITANDVPEGRKVATLLTVIGSATYKLLENLLTPDQPATKSYAELIAALKGHLSPKPLVIAERYRFHKRDQQSGETIAQYTAELRCLARYCEFGAHLKDALRDRLVCGLLNPAICKKLLAEDLLTLDNAEKIALAMETASKDASELSKHSQSAIGASASSATTASSFLTWQWLCIRWTPFSNEDNAGSGHPTANVPSRRSSNRWPRTQSSRSSTPTCPSVWPATHRPGAVLSHVMPSGEERPIAFASCTLSPADRNYSQIDKEALGIVWSHRKFHSYVYGRHFTLVTDHQPLTAIFHPSKHLPTMTASRLQRYAMFLAGQQYAIVYRKHAPILQQQGAWLLTWQKRDVGQKNSIFSRKWVSRETGNWKLFWSGLSPSLFINVYLCVRARARACVCVCVCGGGGGGVKLAGLHTWGLGIQAPPPHLPQKMTNTVEWLIRVLSTTSYTHTHTQMKTSNKTGECTTTALREMAIGFTTWVSVLLGTRTTSCHVVGRAWSISADDRARLAGIGIERRSKERRAVWENSCSQAQVDFDAQCTCSWAWVRVDLGRSTKRRRERVLWPTQLELGLHIVSPASKPCAWLAACR